MGLHIRRKCKFLLRPCLFFAWICLYFYSSQGQGITGNVTESFSHQPVPSASVTISLNDSIVYNTITDDLGRYTFITTQAGRYVVAIGVQNFEPLRQADIVLDGYTTRKLDHVLEKTSWTLPAAVVTAMPKRNAPYIRHITPDDLVQVAGNYDDPVRVALSDPGMIALNDQANHFSARGKSPVFNTWLLEGLDIVNPNHTNNAGTFSDLPTQYGGGINMFSAQTLGSTDIYMGINPMSVNNISGASVDMHLHESPTPEWRVKAGLLGFELGGGAAMGSNNILDFNLRYSFTGVLTALGADFGGEEISYYDGVVSFRNHGLKHALKVFAWAGRSENIFNHPTDSMEIEEYKDFFDIDYGNDILGAGTTFTHTLGRRSNFTLGAALSTNESTYQRFGTFETHTDTIDTKDQITIGSAYGEISIQHSARIKSVIGVNYKTREYNTPDNSSYPYLPFEEDSRLRPYLNAAIDLGPTFRLDAGVDLSWSILHHISAPGYRAALRWNYGDRSSVFAGLRHGAGETTHARFSNTNGGHFLNTFYEGGWNLAGAKHAFTLDVYAHRMNQLIRLDLTQGYIHLADYPFEPSIALPVDVSEDGNALYYGAEGQWEYRHHGWRFFVNQSLYRSERDSGVNDENNMTGRYNGQYATHAVVAREIIREKKGKSRIWNFGLRGLWHGGLWEQAIDVAASEQFYTTVRTNAGTFDRRIPDYKRLDLTIVRTIGEKRIRWRYALDIQNVLGLTNVAYTFYDPYLNAVVDKEQLGLIPVLSVQASW